MDGYAINMHIDMQETMIFQEILQFLQTTEGPTNGSTDQRTDIPSYRDVISASKKLQRSMTALSQSL